MKSLFDQRPIIVAIAGPNGAGKSTFYYAHLRQSGLRFINADVLAHELGLDAYAAAAAADVLRKELVRERESFVFETVFSDPAGAKLAFLNDAIEAGYAVVLCYIGLSDAEMSEERVAMRVSQGGHDVPSEKLAARFPRTLLNLRAAMRRLPHVLIYDNSDLRRPFQKVMQLNDGKVIFRVRTLPRWLGSLM